MTPWSIGSRRSAADAAAAVAAAREARRRALCSASCWGVMSRRTFIFAAAFPIFSASIFFWVLLRRVFCIAAAFEAAPFMFSC
jgi:hypothetical protein